MDTRTDSLTALGIAHDNPAACAHGRWLTGKGLFPSHNPATGEIVARAGECADGDYARVLEAAQAAARRWADLPAP
jgi:acyl-CoA reductase-like NAD-dependent aldehyde dehydrogenase